MNESDENPNEEEGVEIEIEDIEDGVIVHEEYSGSMVESEEEEEEPFDDGELFDNRFVEENLAEGFQGPDGVEYRVIQAGRGRAFGGPNAGAQAYAGNNPINQVLRHVMESGRGEHYDMQELERIMNVRLGRGLEREVPD